MNHNIVYAFLFDHGKDENGGCYKKSESMHARLTALEIEKIGDGHLQRTLNDKPLINSKT
jgi:hypothetical protein